MKTAPCGIKTTKIATNILHAIKNAKSGVANPTTSAIPPPNSANAAIACKKAGVPGTNEDIHVSGC